jgi:hypothetical protein
MTHTFAALDISAAAFEEIKQRLEAVSYQHTFIKTDGQDLIDMQGIALKRETDERVKVYILFDGKKL